MSSTSGQSTTPTCYNVGNGSVTSGECRWNQVDGTNMLQNTMPPEWTQFPPHSVASVPVAYIECQYASSGGQSYSNQSALGIQITQSPGCNKKPGAVKKQKRIRTAFTTQQVLALEEEYASNRYLERQRRIELSKQLDLHDRTLKIWFQNRRMKEKKDREDSEATSTSATPEFHEHQYLPATSYPPVMPASCPPSAMPSYIPPATQASWLPPAMPQSYYSHSMSIPCQTDMALAMSGYQQSSETEFVELAPEVPLLEPVRHESTPSGSSEDNDGDWSRLIMSSLNFVD